jgi:hypothetical protein
LTSWKRLIIPKSSFQILKNKAQAGQQGFDTARASEWQLISCWSDQTNARKIVKKHKSTKKAKRQSDQKKVFCSHYVDLSICHWIMWPACIISELWSK